MNMRPAGLRLFALLLLALLFSACAACAMESTCPPSADVTAVLKRGEAELAVYSGPDRTERLGRLTRGVSCRVLGVRGEYLRLRFGDIDGYALASKLSITGFGRDTGYGGAVTAQVGLDEYLYRTPSLAKTMAVSGTVRSQTPLDTLFVYLWDERLQRMEQTLAVEIKSPGAELDLGRAVGALRFPAISPGRKTLIIQGAADGSPVDICRTPVYVCGIFNAVRNINDRCRFSAGRNQDKMAGRSWTPTGKNDALTVTLPGDGSAALMTVEWRFPAESFTVTALDTDQKEISRETRTTGFYADAVEIPPRAAQLRLTVGGQDNWVRNLCVYDSSYPDNAVQRWQPMPEKLDLMVISPHQDDELLFYGGAIPYACHRGAAVGVVYMANCGRTRYGEALDGLWTTGLTAHPIFMNWRDQWGHSVNNALKGWSQDGTDPQLEVVRLLRKYRPEVIIGPDPEGEYGHAQHKLTSRLIMDAVPLAMDEGYDPQSAREYGVWEVKKVYLHLYTENRIKIDWSVPFSPDSPISPDFLAREGYDKHRSQQQHFSMSQDSVVYDSGTFGLYYTAVGPDEAKNDIFEHIPLGSD